MKKSFALLMGAGLATTLWTGCGDKKNASQEGAGDKFSQSFGVMLGTNLLQAGLKATDINSADFIKGLESALSGTPIIIPEEAQAEVQKRMMALQQQSMQAQQHAMDAQKPELEKAGKEFLAKNKDKAGVKTTASGLQYEVIKEGKGAKPTPESKVKAHYHGTLIDGTVFDSSIERGEPISFSVNGVIPGWQEALQLMSVGSKYKLYIPHELGYGGQHAGKIPPFSTLIFEVELVAMEQ